MEGGIGNDEIQAILLLDPYIFATTWLRNGAQAAKAPPATTGSSRFTLQSTKTRAFIAQWGYQMLVCWQYQFQNNIRSMLSNIYLLNHFKINSTHRWKVEFSVVLVVTFFQSFFFCCIWWPFQSCFLVCVCLIAFHPFGIWNVFDAVFKYNRNGFFMADLHHVFHVWFFFKFCIRRFDRMYIRLENNRARLNFYV